MTGFACDDRIRVMRENGCLAPLRAIGETVAGRRGGLTRARRGRDVDSRGRARH